MQIPTDYGKSPYLNPAYPLATAGTETDGNGIAESVRYSALQRKASVLLADRGLSTLERAHILDLLTRARNAAEQGAVGELTALFSEINRLTPGTTINGAPLMQGGSAPQKDRDAGQGERITYKDRSGDPNVSFKYPVSLNEYQAPLAVMAHERQHVALARADAIINNQDITTYVTYHYGYDSNGRLIITGGTTVTMTHAGYSPEALRIGGRLDIYV